MPVRRAGPGGAAAAPATVAWQDGKGAGNPDPTVSERISSGVQIAAEQASDSTLVSRNVTVNGRRTSLRLEPLMWEALAEIVQRENSSVNDLVSRIENRRAASSLTAAVRVFIVSYFRAAATEDGHAGAGHGNRRTRRRYSPV